VSTKKKVLHVLWSGGIGGAEEYLASLIKYFDSLKYEIAVCMLNEKGEIFEEMRKRSNIALSFIGISRGLDINGAVKFILFLRRGKFDIIHSHTRNFLSMFIMTTFFRKTPIIITHHTGVQCIDSVDIKMQKKTRLFYKLFSAYFQKIIAISNVVKESLINDSDIKNSEKIEVVHNGVDLNKFHKSRSIPSDLKYIQRDNRNIIGFIGRMVPFKRPDLFVEIAAELINKNKKFYFLMVGDGPELEKCKNLIKRYKLNQYFKLLEFRRDIPNILQLFDALLFTSEGEGFGVILIEAMAAGVPVFAINDGAVHEIISHKKNGVLLDTIDPEEIARQIVGIYENKELIDKIKRQSVKDVRDKFSMETRVRHIESIYKKILNGSQ
jgi:glycosyltransferase involved in cell wall biosynthesis